MAIRVAHLIYGLGLGGLEQLVVQLSARGRKRGIEPTLIALGPDGPMRDLARSQDIPLEHITSGGLSLGTILDVRKALQRSGASLLHAHDLGPWLNAVAVRATSPFTKVLVTFHEQRTPEGRKRQAANVAARFSEALVACGDQVRDDIRGWAPSSSRVPVIPNGVPLDPPASGAREQARKELQIPDGAVAIGYLGGLREIKGPDRLVEAFLDRFKDRGDVHLYLIGGGPLEAALRETAKGHGNVHFAGVVVNGARLLPAFDVYAQTSLSEGRSLSMLEAMAAGLPTVAHRLPATEEIHQDGASALLVTLGDRKGLGEALDKLVRDAGLRGRIGAEARTRAQAHSIEPMVDAYAALYRDLS
jgi:glycosyltransferase involved in cell wall biosynthesis